MTREWHAKIERAAPFVISGCLVALASGYILGPAERTMGQYMRIGYLHIGAAWTAYVAYSVTALGALMYLWRRRQEWDWVALAAAEWGVVLTTITLVTGSFWGRAVSGWWWQWSDLRLTLTLLLWFVYAGYLSLRHFTEGERRAVLSAVVAVLGVPTMMLNHFAVRLSQRFHPPPILVREGGASADPAIATAAMASLAWYMLLFLVVLYLRVRVEARRDPWSDPAGDYA